MKAYAVWIFLCGAAMLAGQVGAQGHDPLQRQYHEGDALVYKMTGVNEAWHYTIQADGVVKKDAGGAFFEEYRWSDLESGGQALALSAETPAFRQRLLGARFPSM